MGRKDEPLSKQRVAEDYNEESPLQPGESDASTVLFRLDDVERLIAASYLKSEAQ